MKKNIIVLLIVLLVLIAGGIWAYAQKRTLSIETVVSRHQADLMAVPGVIGVGVGECAAKPCIKVLLEKETSQTETLPKELEGFVVEAEVTGVIETY